MKKTLLILSVVLLVVACKNKDEKSEETTAAPEQPKAAGYAYSETFNQSMTNVLNAYYNLKDAFVASDTAKVNTAAVALKGLLDSLKLDEVKQFDSLGFTSIDGRAGDVAAEISGMLGEKELEKKRESFEMVSNAFYDMVRVIKPTGATIYYQYCPMAFNDKGAYWLSSADSIMNPYFGKKMLTCGEVKETLKY
ncbi:Cu(I)/Ag(I) efflux system membrane fusion protein [Lacibacter cauensis]|uniref:Cu(I)/Ag(I) efflux system membrane fusion protein n=1 Tax=Lacibacter cauensis TaxID=510947 RepID=A0A562SVH9_9BACT|nr:DUF3347 domain-containing protein [Lacibacter cauensis]TWI85068.1 Cu(I)/Ag(I) efflux system membrane fusion protein [Lacibacter cauensis]